MNQELRKVKKWLDANCLALNIDKINFVIFHSPRTKLPEPNVIRFCRERIQREKYVKFLDENLCWKYHIYELSKKLSRTIGIFYKIRHFVPYEVLNYFIILCFIHFCHMVLLFGVLRINHTFRNFLFFKRKLLR